MRSIILLSLLLASGTSFAEAPAAPAAPAKKAKRPARELSQLKLLYFHASWCHSCKRFEAAKVLDTVEAAEPKLAVQPVDVDTQQELLSRYNVEVTPTLVLIDSDGVQLSRPRIDLDDGPATAARVLKTVRRLTGQK